VEERENSSIFTPQQIFAWDEKNRLGASQNQKAKRDEEMQWDVF